MSQSVNSRPELIMRELARQVENAGFNAFGVLGAGEATDRQPVLQAFTGAGLHGEMQWLARDLERRGHPNGLWPQARSVIMLAMNYGPAENPLRRPAAAGNGVISVYARGKDYHSVINRRLKQVAGWLHRELGAEVKVFVDTAPVMEKPLAQQAGLGWQGKHTNLVSRGFGSWLFLGAIYTTAELPASAPESDHCGGCVRCLQACPTEAFIAPYRLDARRCISYLTIEHRGPVPRQLRAAIGNRVFGCDDCLAVCPWNKFASEANEQRFHAREHCDDPPLRELLRLDEAAFQQRFKGTPVKRTGRDGMVRNALIAAGNSGDATLIEEIEPLLRDEAGVVRAMAIWALARLASKDRLDRLRAAHMVGEGEEEVLREWRETANG